MRLGLAACGLAGLVGGALALAAVWPDAMAAIHDRQQALYRSLAGAMDRLAADGDVAAATALATGSFLYGVFHAAGPGHGKAILTTYLLTQRDLVGRAVGMAAAGAFCQGLVALALVYGFVLLAGWLPRDVADAVVWSERASFALVAALGAYLVWRAVRAIRRGPVGTLVSDGPGDGHHGVGHGSCAAGAACGHRHSIAPELAVAAEGWRARVGLVLSMGLRPCSGAVLVLVFAQATGLAWAGIASVAAMSAGTAAATGTLAVLAVTMRERSLRLVGTAGVSAHVGPGLALAGGLVLVAVGGSLLGATFAPRHPFAI